MVSPSPGCDPSGLRSSRPRISSRIDMTLPVAAATHDTPRGGDTHVMGTTGEGSTPNSSGMVEERLFRTVLEGIDEGVVVVDREGLITFATPAYAAMLQIDLEQM